MRKLGDVADGRDNNLDMIRLCAALAVLVSHAWPITNGPGTLEPLQAQTGITLGTYAVMVFFGLSGYLVTASFQRDPDPWRFCLRRIRRLWPGLTVCLGLTAFCVGPLVSDLSMIAYLSAESTWLFLLLNGLMVGFQGDLPGVFQDNPYPIAAGSIWTLQYEVVCYCAVLLVGGAGLLERRCTALMTLGTAILVATIAVHFQDSLPTRLIRLAEFVIPFAFGGLAWIWRDRVALNSSMALGMICAAALTFGTVLQLIIVPMAITYTMLVLGYVGPKFWHLPGDYSYGIYIYAFPVQGLVVHYYGTMDPWMNIFLAFPPTVILAVFSWHLVEKPCLLWSKPQTGLAKWNIMAK